MARKQVIVHEYHYNLVSAKKKRKKKRIGPANLNNTRDPSHDMMRLPGEAASIVAGQELVHTWFLGGIHSLPIQPGYSAQAHFKPRAIIWDLLYVGYQSTLRPHTCNPTTSVVNFWCCH